MRVHVVDPSAYTPPYDHALCAALARGGAEVELITSRFAYGSAPAPEGYVVRELFYRRALGPPGSRLRLATKSLEHAPDMLGYRRLAGGADVVHFQWLAAQWLDRYLLPRRPSVLTAHDLLPREPRPMQVRSQRRLYGAVDAVVAHSGYGRRELVENLGVDPAKVRVIHHGAFDYLASLPNGELPGELGHARGPVVLFFGLLRPYKGLDVLLDAWRELGSSPLGGDGVGDAERPELWIVGRPRMAIDALVTGSPAGVKWVTRFVSDLELAACFRRADVVTLPYVETERFDFSGVLATALAFSKPAVITDVGGFREVAEAGAARLVAPRDPDALGAAIRALLADPGERQRLAQGAGSAAAGPYSWTEAARQTLALYQELVA
jgi:glycosyltransferase involved in cell wall biosynthesis